MSKAQIADLWALQQLDLEIERAAAEQETLRATLATDTTRSARVALAQRARDLQAREQRQKSAESALEETRTRLDRQEKRLYGGAVNAKDIDRAQAEIEHLRTMRAEQEEGVLTAMLAIEEAQTQVDGLRAALETTVATQQRDQAAARERLAALEPHLAEQRAAREAQAALCTDAMLARYNGLRRAHAGRALAEVRNRVCQVCRVTLADSTMQHARAGGDFVLCDNCGRILYLA